MMYCCPMRQARTLGGDDEARQTASLVGVVIVLFIIVIALFVIRKLQVRVMLENCLMSQHSGCELAVDRLRVSRVFARF